MESKEKLILDIYALEAGGLEYSFLLEKLGIEPVGKEEFFHTKISGKKDTDSVYFVSVKRMSPMIHIGVHRRGPLSPRIHEYILETGGAMIMSDDPSFKPTERSIELSQKLNKARVAYHT